jgi:hypothetical protein
MPCIKGVWSISLGMLGYFPVQTGLRFS